jgi:hypothetical protein
MKSLTIAVTSFLSGVVIAVTGGTIVHDTLDEPHERQPIELDRHAMPEAGFTVYDGEMILVVDGDRVLTFYRKDLVEVCKDVTE